jgi:hypothetical protein
MIATPVGGFPLPIAQIDTRHASDYIRVMET